MKQLLVLVFLALNLGADAQKVRFTDSTNKWNFLRITLEIGMPSTPRFYMSKWEEARFLSDTIVDGIAYRRIRDYRSSGSNSRNVLIREDTLQQKIWFRYSLRYSPQDTVENLLFDYNLQPGDTLIRGLNKHVVEAMDSVLMGAERYRTWTLRSLVPWVYPLYYTFIEGIGPLNDPLFSTYPETGYGASAVTASQLRCFYSNNLRLDVTPPPPLPQISPGNSFGGVAQVPLFDNNTSCFASVGINNVSRPDPAMVYPNPGDKNMVLQSPAAFREGRLRICDMTGRIIYERSFANVDKLPIGQYLSIPGVYFYTLHDAATGRHNTGRFIFR